MENQILQRLAKSKFRSSFHLRKYMIDYIDDKGIEGGVRNDHKVLNVKAFSNYFT